MKIKFLLWLFLQTLAATLVALNPETLASRYEHLGEVNRYWQGEAPNLFLRQKVFFANDRQRIQQHLMLVEQALRTADCLSLTTSQGANRLRHLAALRTYCRAGQFPTNLYHSTRQPYFRDDAGVLCAVGYLLWQDGQYDLVNRINAENNYGYLPDLAALYPEIKDWAAQNGFTVNELAWIQPAYPPDNPGLQHWGTGQGLNPGGRINVLAKNGDETLLFAAGHFSAIDGVTAGNIAVWDGVTWQPFSTGVEGEVYAMEYRKLNGLETLLIGGDFHLPGEPDKQNVAEYNFATQTWASLQTGDMEGAVRAVHYIDVNAFVNGILIGGNFQKVNGEDWPYIAHWYRNSNGGLWNYYKSWLHTDGPVNFFCNLGEYNGDYIGVAGAFEKVLIDDANGWLDAPHLVYLKNIGWQPIVHDLPPVRALAFHAGNVVAGCDPTYMGSSLFSPALHIMKAGLWHSQGARPLGDSLLHGFSTWGNYLLVFGGLWTFVGNKQCSGLFAYEGGANNLTEALLWSDSTIRAAIGFQGQIHIAGDFLELYNEPFAGLARFSPPFVSVISPARDFPFEVTTTTHQLSVRQIGSQQSARLALYDLQGRLLYGQSLHDLETSIASTALPAGLYVWQIECAGKSKAGKWALAP